jgi:DNA-directed RNA polymerase specialized sigma subunit, sigma24 homolog
MKPQSQEIRIQHQFDTLCKAVLKYGSRDYYRKLKKRREHEVMFSELSEQDLAKLFVTDIYFKDAFNFSVLGHDISVTDEQLAEALQSLSIDRRNIILLAFFLGMNDYEIAEKLNLVRRTVTHRRSRALQELKSKLEGNADE